MLDHVLRVQRIALEFDDEVCVGSPELAPEAQKLLREQLELFFDVPGDMLLIDCIDEANNGVFQGYRGVESKLALDEPELAPLANVGEEIEGNGGLVKGLFSSPPGER
ncbi:MAG: hypothetical protein RBG13Loki_4116 [Promethearchaeota archaeon CR_4]|nr:MAG: hypothetical protein RBG13Loki_4116 [Candidatus Lokiarchaeota archaeon CR_4]